MTKQTENQKLVNQAVKGLITRLEKAESFVVEQAPALVKEIVLVETAQEKRDLWRQAVASASSFLILCAALGTIVYVSLHPAASLEYHSESAILSDRQVGLLIAAVVISVFTGVGVLCNASAATASYDQLQRIKLAPKLFVLEKLRRLVR